MEERKIIDVTQQKQRRYINPIARATDRDADFSRRICGEGALVLTGLGWASSRPGRSPGDRKRRILSQGKPTPTNAQPGELEQHLRSAAIRKILPVMELAAGVPIVEIDEVSSPGCGDGRQADQRSGGLDQLAGMLRRYEGGGMLMKPLRVFGLVVMLTLTAPVVWADDLTGSSKFLCAAVQATQCLEGGECGVDLPWNLNIPEFIEVDLDAKRLSTTQASGKNRTTAIAYLSRADGTIVLQGFEMGRAFSIVIAEQTGRATAAVATGGRAVAVFCACTPLPAVAGPGAK